LSRPTQFLPILQRIQADVADIKREVDKINGDLGQIHVTLGQHGRKLDAIEGYLTYQLGITSRTIADVEALKSDILEIKRRVEVLEH
jgi:DNA anti-recombination protein RmuC